MDLKNILIGSAGAAVAAGAIYFGRKWFARAERAPVVDAAVAAILNPAAAFYTRHQQIIKTILKLSGTILVNEAVSNFALCKKWAPWALPGLNFASNYIDYFLPIMVWRRLLACSVTIVSNTYRAWNPVPLIVEPALRERREQREQRERAVRFLAQRRRG
jgi:hypothetical protein